VTDVLDSNRTVWTTFEICELMIEFTFVFRHDAFEPNAYIFSVPAFQQISARWTGVPYTVLP
jgi:hypothetical protein